jgi:protein phosphatase
VDFFEEMPLTSSRHYLMCTDGLFNHVEDEEMRQIVLAHNPERACRQLIQLANERGGSDNITVQVVRVDVNATTLSPLSRSREKLKSIWKPGKK